MKNLSFSVDIVCLPEFLVSDPLVFLFFFRFPFFVFSFFIQEMIRQMRKWILVGMIHLLQASHLWRLRRIELAGAINAVVQVVRVVILTLHLVVRAIKNVLTCDLFACLLLILFIVNNKNLFLLSMHAHCLVP